MKNKLILSIVLTTSLSIFGYSQNQLELNEAAYKKYQNADKELNTVYKQLLSKTDKTDRNLLIAAEKDWIKYRDSHCKFEEKIYDGGSIQPLIYNECLTAITQQRISIIKQSIKDRSN